MEHTPGFLKTVNDARQQVQEVSVAEARTRLAQNPKAVLLDVREDGEWQAGHAVEAVHLGKGVLERDIERMFPDPATELLMYCGGGYRSAISCAAAQKMGYTKVLSIRGGYRSMTEAAWPTTR